MSGYQNDRNGQEKSAGEQFVDHAVRGAGWAAGASVVGAIVAVILCPAPGSPEIGAKIGATIGKAFSGL